MAEKKKMGRPTDEPKPHKISAWISDDALKALDDYCERAHVNRPQGIRDGIALLKDKK